MVIEASCKTCRFAEENKEDGRRRCRFNPPTILTGFAVHQLTGRPETTYFCNFPECPSDDLGCGRWQADPRKITS
jgi:hypothetical protein